MEAPPEAMAAPVIAPPPRGGYRGRGGPMRGSFERGRGRGMGRGHFMGRGGGMMVGGPPPQGMGPGGRGMRPPRGSGYQGRGSYMRGGGPPMRGRPPLYAQPKQHTGAENNKTVSPVPTAPPTAATPAPDGTTPEMAAASNGTTTVTEATVVASVPVSTNGVGVSGLPPRGHPRGRGSYSRGRGGYNSHLNGGMHGMGPGGEHVQMGMRRGGPSRGRGGYGQMIPRAPMHAQPHTANTQIAPVPSLKRGAPGGPPGPKRGRYEGGPYSQRPMAPKYHQNMQHAAPMAQQTGAYGAPPSHHQQQSHHGYAVHEQSQAVDPYAQSYSAPAAQSSYNGYGQSGYATHASTSQANSAYSTQGTEYDQYQGYSAGSYGSQQDNRYQTYGQDYTQQYGAPAVDYNTAPQADYSQHGQQAYDERAYAGYDSQYQQGYSNAAGYY